jgi:hypothetical protein
MALSPVPGYIADISGRTTMTIKECGLTARGILSLFLPWLSVTPFAKADVDNEVKVNQAFARKSESQRNDYRIEYEPVVKQRMQTFRSGVWGSFWFLFSAFVVALILRALWHASPDAKLLVGVASIFVFAWSTLARLGRNATSFGGNTIIERIDVRLLWILYWIGTVLGTIALI